MTVRETDQRGSDVQLTELHHLVQEFMRVAQALQCQAGGPGWPSGRGEAQGEAACAPPHTPTPHTGPGKGGSELPQPGRSRCGAFTGTFCFPAPPGSGGSFKTVCSLHSGI